MPSNFTKSAGERCKPICGTQNPDELMGNGQTTQANLPLTWGISESNQY